jgi:hypothetical protein
MFEFRNKTILILSPQPWGIMFLSKHHYAIELAKRGNKVYFLNPPTNQKIRSTVSIKELQEYSGLYIIEHQLKFGYRLKFRLIFLFHFLMKYHLKKILAKIDAPVDIVWSFDIGNLIPLSFFTDAIKIFHPVDRPHNKDAFSAARGSEIIISVTNEILDEYKQMPALKCLINHGISDDFLIPPGVIKPAVNPVRVGLSGNFARPDIDREVLLNIIKTHENILFECWGSYQINQSNLGGSYDELQLQFIESLKKLPNVILHGPVMVKELKEGLNRMDAFLICYDILKDHSQGTNYHKVLEYLSTGKVIVSNNMTAYKNQTELLEMSESRVNNNELPALFKEVIANLNKYNSSDKQKNRIEYAKTNSYSNQINRIERIIDNANLYKIKN